MHTVLESSPRWFWWAAKSWKHGSRPDFVDKEPSSLPLPKGLPIASLTATLFLNADSVQCYWLKKKLFFSEATINFGECPLPCFHTSRDRKHTYNVCKTPHFPLRWLVCHFPALLFKTVAVERAHWTAEAETNMASRLLSLAGLAVCPN